MQVPLISFEYYDLNGSDAVEKIAAQMSLALKDVGFMSVSDLGISQDLLERVFAASQQFFASDLDTKMKSAYLSASENFGYQGFGAEHLDPSKPADLKETFTMRDILNHGPDDNRWPSDDFRRLMTHFYAECLQGAHRMQRILASALDVDEDFFVNKHRGENVTLRLLYYPDTGVDEIAESQLGAGEHTDYGLLTLLFQDDVGGLEVSDANGNWIAVEPVPTSIVVNSGDLLERWTNGIYRSTPHRVKPKIGHKARFSIAMFVDPDSATQVDVLPSCISRDRPSRFDTITAGEHIQERIEATHKGADSS
jgi:isopenicillin N synthase-like dioxygenase